MIAKSFGRVATLLTFALLLASSTLSYAQKIISLSSTQVGDLFSGTDAGALRNKLITLHSGKVGATGAAEQISFTEGSKSVRIEYASQLITYKAGNAEQITIKITENNVVNTINLVQYDNGQVGTLDGNNLSVRSLRGNYEDCINDLFGPGSACAACETKINNCMHSNLRVIKMLQCFIRSIDGSCVSCGVDYYTLYACVLLR